MSGFLGADTTQLREASARFSQRNEVLQDTAQRTRRLVQEVTWVGPDAESFRAEGASIADQLMLLAACLGEQALVLRGHADQQDEASSDVGGPGGTAAWRPDLDRLRDILPWPSGSATGTGSRWGPVVDPLWELDNKILAAVLDQIDRLMDPRNPLWKAAKKIIPAVPELRDLAIDLVEGDSVGFMVGHARLLVSVTPLGWVEDVSGLLFPTLPDGWKYPGSNVKVNEGSLLDGVESILREEYESSDSWQMERVKAAEQEGMEISDRLGIENQYARNAIKTVSGTAAGMHVGNLDPLTGEVWVLSAPFGHG